MGNLSGPVSSQQRTEEPRLGEYGGAGDFGNQGIWGAQGNRQDWSRGEEWQWHWNANGRNANGRFEYPSSGRTAERFPRGG